MFSGITDDGVIGKQKAVSMSLYADKATAVLPSKHNYCGYYTVIFG